MKTAQRITTRVRTLAALCLLSVASIAGAQATYPDRALTMVVPFPPGGTTDIIARTLAHAMTKELDQSIVIENRAGADRWADRYLAG